MMTGWFFVRQNEEAHNSITETLMAVTSGNAALIKKNKHVNFTNTHIHCVLSYWASEYFDLIIIFIQLQVIWTWMLIGFKHYQVTCICVMKEAAA